jgi:hypothetical protein
VTQADVVAATAKRLGLFVLRAAVKIEAANDLTVAALLDADDEWLAAHGLRSTLRANGVVACGELACVRLGPNLWHVLGPRAAVDGFAPELVRAREEEALLAEIGLGLPAVSAPLVERFVAQMLNLDLLDAVSFDKGCYPGQEVIARVHHRGSVKRRMRRYACAVQPLAARTVVGAGGAEVGEVVRAAPARDGIELLAVVEHAAAAHELLVSGERLRELPLPYVVPND